MCSHCEGWLLSALELGMLIVAIQAFRLPPALRYSETVQVLIPTWLEKCPNYPRVPCYSKQV